MTIRIAVDQQALVDFCRRSHIHKLALYGSVLGEGFRTDSDVDVLVEFEEGHTPGWELFNLEDELSTMLGRRVDLNTPGFLHRSFRQRVLEEARVLYAA